jgi:large subunit ribosomal protein L9
VKVILLEDVKALGKKGDLVNASEGYARNMLFPKKLAVPATAGNQKDLEAKKRSEDKHAAEALAAAKELKAEIEQGFVTLSIKVGEGGRVFGSVSAKEIALAAKDQLGLELDKKKLNLSQPIKEIGEKKVQVKLHPKVTADLKVIVKEA